MSKLRCGSLAFRACFEIQVTKYPNTQVPKKPKLPWVFGCLGLWVLEFSRHVPSLCRFATRPAVAPALWLALLLCGCASPGSRNIGFSRPFVFGQDTFAYPNELVWFYYRDPDSGKLRHKDRQPPPSYSHHCFVVARSARQFFQNARFDPARPVADEATYRTLIRRVVSTNLRDRPKEEKTLIPGYPSLSAFSAAQEKLLKEECGSAWQSYFQRGHWRMIFPFTRGQQERLQARLLASIRQRRPPVVHLVRFPYITINHAVVLFDAKETEQQILFAVYDPYDPAKPAQLIFNRKERRFYFPPNDYFLGGRVDAYEVYCSWKY